MLDIKRVLAAAPREHDPEPFAPLRTCWGKQLSPDGVLPQHPRPQCARSGCLMLHGHWDYAIVESERESEASGTMAPIPSAGSMTEGADADSTLSRMPSIPAGMPESCDGSILVPFSPEAPLSGVQRQLKPSQHLWYRLRFQASPSVYETDFTSLDFALPRGKHAEPLGSIGTAPALISAFGKVLAVKSGQRCLLHFDGVDHRCSVWLNGTLVARHQGAYRAFQADITNALTWGENELVLRVEDPSDTGPQLRGKQKLESGGIWYTAQSGIWQPVWLETVPDAHIVDLQIQADMHGDLRIRAITNKPAAPMKVALFHRDDPSPIEEQRDGDAILRFRATKNSENPCMQEASLHVDDARLWSPEEPNLYAMEIRCGDDKVQSYCAFRSVEVAPDADGTPRFFLNGSPYFLRGVLDQGYWPDGLLTAPSDEALAFDIASMKELGFNMLRKHIKIENERWYWHCDRLGMLVWQDMPNGGTDYDAWATSRTPTLMKASWTCQRDDTPSGQARLSADNPAMQQEWVATCRDAVRRLRNHPCIVSWVLFNEGWGQFDAQAATRMAAELDPTRPIDATSGWYDRACGNYWSVHNYFRPLQVWPDHRVRPPRAFVISEFGGLTLHVAEHSTLERSYGYESFTDPQQWHDAVCTLLRDAEALESQGLCGYVYTQLSDVEEETNGILTYDRAMNKLAMGA